jgi:hypothetical protein
MKKYFATILVLFGTISVHADLQNSKACKVARQMSSLLGSPLEDAFDFLVKNKPEGVDVRIWVPGGSTWSNLPVQENRLDIDISIIDGKALVVGTNCG